MSKSEPIRVQEMKDGQIAEIVKWPVDVYVGLHVKRDGMRLVSVSDKKLYWTGVFPADGSRGLGYVNCFVSLAE